jgi:hypothetical protein
MIFQLLKHFGSRPLYAKAHIKYQHFILPFKTWYCKMFCCLHKSMKNVKDHVCFVIDTCYCVYTTLAKNTYVYYYANKTIFKHRRICKVCTANICAHYTVLL